mgnify:CR=1 FL=1
MHANVLVEGNLIKQVSTKPISADGATVIDGFEGMEGNGPASGTPVRA